MSDSVLGPTCPYCTRPITQHDRAERCNGQLWHEQCVMDWLDGMQETSRWSG